MMWLGVCGGREAHMSVELLGAGEQRAWQTRGTSRSRWRDARVKIRRHWQLYLVIALPTAFLITFNYIPMVGVQIAFRDYNPIGGRWGSRWPGSQALQVLLQSWYFLSL